MQARLTRPWETVLEWLAEAQQDGPGPEVHQAAGYMKWGFVHAFRWETGEREGGLSAAAALVHVCGSTLLPGLQAANLLIQQPLNANTYSKNECF